ncbi:MAG: class I SAM-dependent rRNA methyltransferase [Polyangiaceae bacterium]|nr:class I SAM-dependent rRNA methyltransferase [Polyangiaceae bacterium]
MQEVQIKPGHVQPIWAGHPWVFAQAMVPPKQPLEAGAEVLVVDSEGKPLGRGLYSPSSALRVRLFTRDPAEALDEKLLRVRLERALTVRRSYGLPSAETNAFRWIYAEGDQLPGLIVDVFGETAVVQFGTVGMAQRRELVLKALTNTLPLRAVVEQSSAFAAKTEGFEALRGVIFGEASSATLRFKERGFNYEVPESLAQKTGFYLDQRPLRDRVEALAKGRRVLDLFSYVGSISLAAKRGGAERVLAVDSSEPALTVLKENAERNRLGIDTLLGDANEVVRNLRGKERFDLIICDPPKLAPRRSARVPAEKLMRRLVRDCSELLTPGGILIVSSCSAALDINTLTRTLALGARDAGHNATVLERVFQGADHPVPAAFSEGLYLSSVISVVG